MVFQLPYKASIYDSNFLGKNMSKEEPNMICSYWIKVENSEITHYYRTNGGSIMESKEKLLDPDNLEVKKLEDKVIKSLKKISEIDKDFTFYYGWDTK
jgi:hypothetical protein